MLTITTYKKLEGLLITTEPLLKVDLINQKPDRYSIWLSNRANIEIERDIHKTIGNSTYYKVWYSRDGKDELEFVTVDLIDTLAKMKGVIKIINEKYDIPF